MRNVTPQDSLRAGMGARMTQPAVETGPAPQKNPLAGSHGAKHSQVGNFIPHASRERKRVGVPSDVLGVNDLSRSRFLTP